MSKSQAPGIGLAVLGVILIVVSIILSAVGYVNIGKANYKDADAAVISAAIFSGLGLIGLLIALFLLKSDAGQIVSMAAE